MPRNTWKKIIVNPRQLQKKKKNDTIEACPRCLFFVSLFKTTLALNVFFLSSLFVHFKKQPPPKNKKKTKTRKGLKTYKC